MNKFNRLDFAIIKVAEMFGKDTIFIDIKENKYNYYELLSLEVYYPCIFSFEYFIVYSNGLFIILITMVMTFV